ncbi:MAG: M42 family metallopeptidase [Firmicutes bacterium]|nr:M42 family metallopeptidase [Bacillota bacterium]
MKDTIKKLVEAYGPSGNEERVRDVIVSMIRGYCDSISVDALGNLIAFKKAGPAAADKAAAGAASKVMVAAHMDEIGLIVTHIDEKGFLRFAPVGGVDPFTILGQRVVFANSATGAVWMEKLDKMSELKIDRMFIDVGASSEKEASQRASIGDMAVFDRKMEENGDRIITKAADDRVGCAVVVEVMRRLKSVPHDAYFVFTVQEEVGTRGATTSAFGIYPDVAIAVDVTRTGDTPKSDHMNVSLGKGAAIKVKDSRLVAHPGVRRLLVSTATAHSIPYQMEVLERGGTDAGPIHTTREGVPSGVISIPTRYVHTPVEMVDLRDVEACVRLLEKTLSGPMVL